jgi:hypothetical protein
MFPGIYEFRWELIHVAFLGAFFMVVVLLAGFVALAALRAADDVRRGRCEALRWAEDFHDLPAAARACRHELSGRFRARTCDNRFDCRTCATHARLWETDDASTDPARTIAGFDLPADRLYHRGHTWARPEEDGTFTVGLDDFATRLLGPPGRLRLPAPGSRVMANGTAWSIRREDVDLRALSPLDGEVVATGGAGLGWYLRLRPLESPPDTRHLLRGPEAAAWMLREHERLQDLVRTAGPGPALANGGRSVQDLWHAIPAAKRDAVLGAFFLDP